VELIIPVSASASFHGRDVFAPAAAALAIGTSLESLGSPSRAPIIRRTPEPHRLGDGSLAGEVISVDRFGNAITNLVGLRPGVIELGTSVLAVRRTYADVPVGAPLAIVGSSGLIEVAVREGSGARHFSLTRGSPIVFRPTTTG
jgi:S-adenosylmethionine hydrolase